MTSFSFEIQCITRHEGKQAIRCSTCPCAIAEGFFADFVPGQYARSMSDLCGTKSAVIRTFCSPHSENLCRFPEKCRIPHQRRPKCPNSSPGGKSPWTGANGWV